jgi:hypothetical protein
MDELFLNKKNTIMEDNHPEKDLIKPEEIGTVVGYKKNLTIQEKDYEEEKQAFLETSRKLGVLIERKKKDESISDEEINALKENHDQHVKMMQDIQDNIKNTKEHINSLNNSEKTKESQVKSTKSKDSYEEFKVSKDKKYESDIKTAHDFRQLTRNINELGDITAPDGYVYKKDDVIQNILAVRDGNAELDTITSTHGLRKHVEKLLEEEKLKKKLEDKYKN